MYSSDHKCQEGEASQSPSPKLVVEHHVTVTGAVVDLFQTDYSESVRTYRLCRSSTRRLSFSTVVSSNDAKSLMLLIFLVLAPHRFLINFLWPSEALTNAAVEGDRYGNGDGASSLSSMEPVEQGPFCLLAVCFCCLLLLGRLVYAASRVHVEEITVIRGLGLQVSTYGLLGAEKSRRFIDNKLLRDLIIHDAFFRTQVIFFLSATIENEAQRLVLFEETLPRLAVLRPVLCGLRHILFDEPEEWTTSTGSEEVIDAECQELCMERRVQTVADGVQCCNGKQ
ncbi:putative GPI GlcNAc transferase complex PIG H component [Trypanosoma vivax]|uniref:Phosphatidylinositol N-acetylglucosaminyltransferase subunit H conserved domain-containing protein n=1 Tax=Trypanosoma vivax (strain Y486) TaxID=1055687 RepID=G0TVZ3_TRYVY|nr:hypothetical protein TRVL_03025 [Trypanosoma vivax]KAH8607125.1 putative GPI GlcNAc transferase complex PIG H component [Trypanosoma vivax]CCC48109.1 conserved hypothetical protein [Trypanosoma vivax Y486]